MWAAGVVIQLLKEQAMLRIASCSGDSIVDDLANLVPYYVYKFSAFYTLTPDSFSNVHMLAVPDRSL